MKTVFLRVLKLDDKATALRTAIRESAPTLRRDRFEVDSASFAAVPRSPFAYWVSDAVRRLFTFLPSFEQSDRNLRVGLATTSDPIFVRLWSEVAPAAAKGTTWIPYAKGGSFSRYYQDVHLVVEWTESGRWIKARVREMGDTPSRYVASEERYGQPGLTYPRRTQGGFNVREMPRGCIFANKGPSIFVAESEGHELLILLALMNSAAFRLLLSLQMAFGSYEVGVVQRTPIPKLDSADRLRLAHLARRIWSLKRGLDMSNATSHAFTLPALLQCSGDKLDTRTITWSDKVQTFSSEIANIQAEIDDLCFDLYGIDEVDRIEVTEGSTGVAAEAVQPPDVEVMEDDEAEHEAERRIDSTGLAADLPSWAAGVAFGRFDVRLATGARPLPREPEPFDPLPACSPGMLTGDGGLPLTSAPTGYPIAFPDNGILVDDPGHARDLTAAVRAVFDEVFSVDAHRWWNELAAVLDPKDHDMRSWITSSFFEYHLKIYSRSRRKAPILWQLATASGQYSVWLYAHRLTRDTFFQVQNDVVGPKLAHEERQLTSLLQSAGANPSATERKKIAAQESFVEELRVMLDEVKRVAPLWNPNLDDGVVLTMAPLWRLVPQHKSWQKELRTKWDELAAGKYDWAHIAMHLWPERVVPKCSTDRSLAIAHGLEDVFWVEGANGKWSPRPTPTQPLDELVRERSSTAVKAALDSLPGTPQGRSPAGQKAGKRRARQSNGGLD